jgi:hypothetical protein
MTSRNTDWIRRGIRSFIQGFIGVLVLVAVPIINQWATTVGSGGQIEIDIPFWRSVAFAAVGGGMVSLIAFVQNWLEDNTNAPAILKDKPSTGKNPVPDV